jgi:hypothetical protein
MCYERQIVGTESSYQIRFASESPAVGPHEASRHGETIPSTLHEDAFATINHLVPVVAIHRVPDLTSRRSVRPRVVRFERIASHASTHQTQPAFAIIDVWSVFLQVFCIRRGHSYC